MTMLLIDGNSILSRAFYAMTGPKMLSTSDGVYTNAVYGFVNMINKCIQEVGPEYIGVAFDLKAPTFRHKEYESYKAKRMGMPQELAMQVPIVKEVLDSMNIHRLECEGFEADDIIGTVCRCAEESELKTVILTGDKDTFQLISHHTEVKLIRTKGGKTITQTYDLKTFTLEYGIEPKNVIDLKALMGDSSDNIPGIAGVGEKTAIKLIQQYKDIDNLYLNINSIENSNLKNKLINGKHFAYMSKRLATIQTKIPGICDNIESLKRCEYDKVRLYELFKRLEFKQFIDKFGLADAVNTTETYQDFSCDEKKIQIINEDASLKSAASRCCDFEKVSIYYLLDKTQQFEQQLIAIAITGMKGEDRNHIYINLQNVSQENFLMQFKPMFEDNSIKKYGHEVKNLMVYLINQGIRVKGFVFDTCIAAYIVEPSSSTYNLTDLAQKYLNCNIKSMDQVIYKSKFLGNTENSKLLITCSSIILNLADRLLDILKDRQQLNLYFELEHPLIEVLAQIEVCGVKIDIQGLNDFSLKIGQRIEELKNRIYEIAQQEFNINSTKQLSNILFCKLKLPVIKKNKTGYSTDIKVLEQLSLQHEIVALIIEYRQHVKLKSTYVDGLLSAVNSKTGKIHSSFNQTVTSTGRISSTEPNLQNIPIKLDLGREIRKVFIASDHHFLLASADYSQIELRVLAHIAQDQDMITAFKNGEDIHTNTAQNIFHVQKDNVTSVMRSRAKTINFGIVYGMSDFSLAKDLKISRKEAKDYIDEYFSEYSGVKKYMIDIVKCAKNDGYVTTLFNRRRYVPQLYSNNFNEKSGGERIAINAPIQGTAADIIKFAMINVYKKLTEKNLRSRLILQIHDELIVETYKEEENEVRDILKDCMESAASLQVPLKVDVKIGCCWYDAK